MVCLNKNLPQISEMYFYRSDFDRMNFHYSANNLYEHLEDLTNNGLESQLNIRETNFKDFILEAGIRGTIILGVGLLIYGLTRLLEYYSILEKLD